MSLYPKITPLFEANFYNILKDLHLEEKETFFDAISQDGDSIHLEESEIFFDASEQQDPRLQIFHVAIQKAAEEAGKSVYSGFGARFLKDFDPTNADETTRKIINQAAIWVGKAGPRNINEIATILYPLGISLPAFDKSGFIIGTVPILKEPQVEEIKLDVPPQPDARSEITAKETVKETEVKIPPVATKKAPEKPKIPIAPKRTLLQSEKPQYPLLKDRIRNPESLFADHAKRLIEGIRVFVPNPNPNDTKFEQSLADEVNKVLYNNTLESKFSKTLKEIREKVDALVKPNEEPKSIYQEYREAVGNEKLAGEFRLLVRGSLCLLFRLY